MPKLSAVSKNRQSCFLSSRDPCAFGHVCRNSLHFHLKRILLHHSEFVFFFVDCCKPKYINLTCVYITSPGGCHGGSVLFLLGTLRFFCHDQHHRPRQGWRSESLQRILTLDYQDIPLILTVLPLQLCKTVIVWNPVIFVLMNPMVKFFNSIESLHCIVSMIPQT